jgi:predicted ATPase
MMNESGKTKRLQGRITEVTIRGFRSLRSIDKLQLPQLTVLIGANGVGKSSFIRFFEMLGWMLRAQNLQEFVLRQGGGDDQFFMGARRTPSINADVRIETGTGFNDYQFELSHLSAGDTVMLMREAYRYSAKAKPTQAKWTNLSTISKESALTDQENPTARTIYGLLRQCYTYQFHDTSANASIRQHWDTSDSVRLRSDGGNLAAVLLDLQTNERPRYKQIVRQIQRVLPHFDDFVLEPNAGKVLLRWKSNNSDKVFGAHLTSDGSLRLFCLLTLLSLSNERLPDVLFFDEPELGLHPHAIVLVSEMMKRVSQTRQIFIATQSPYMVDCFDLENIIVAEAKNGETQLRNFQRVQYQEWLDDDYLLSDIWLKSAIGESE